MRERISIINNYFYLDGIIRIINGVITLVIGLLIYKRYQQNKKQFYLFWGVGFISYAFSIIIRTLIGSEPVTDPSMAQWFTFVLYMVGSILIIYGIGDLIEKKYIAKISLVLLPIVPLIAYNFAHPELLGWIITLTPYFIISFGLIYIKYKYKVTLDLFIIGWNILLLSNLSWALNLMNPITVDLFAIFGKITIYYGTQSSMFDSLVNDMKHFLLSGLPSNIEGFEPEHLCLVSTDSKNKNDEMNWIIQKTRENIDQGVRTIMVSPYDNVSEIDLMENGLEKNSMYYVRMLPSIDPFSHNISDNAATLNDGTNQLDFLISEIVKFSYEHNIWSDIIISSLSLLIYTQGWQDLLQLMITKLPEIKNSQVRLYLIYYPLTHNIKDIAKFEKIADKILVLGDMVDDQT